MRIEYVHASKYGNGEKVAEAFRQEMAGAGIEVIVHHVDDISPKALPPADLYVFSSPGRMGRPIGSIRRLLKRLQLPSGTRYALLTTEMAPQPDKMTGRIPTEEEICRFQHVRAIMHELLQKKGLIPVGEERVYVTGLQGPLEAGWERKVAAYTSFLRREMAVVS
jgi:flavodoxin